MVYRMNTPVVSQIALPIDGRLYAYWRFIVYKKGGQKSYTIIGNAVGTNVSRNQNTMFRNSFKDAKFKLYDTLGGSPKKFTAYLSRYYFLYNKDESEGKTGKKYSKSYYNNQIPETERNFNRKTNPRIQRKQQKKRVERGIKIIRGGKNESKRKTGNNKKNKSLKQKNKIIQRTNQERKRRNENIRSAKKTNRKRNKNKSTQK